MLSKTKVSSRYQTVVPASVRKDYGIEPGDVLEWDEKGGRIVITVRKMVTLNDITGMVEYGGDAVRSKKKAQRGGR